MLRTFETNYLREVTELSSSLWEFSPNEGEFQGNVYPVWVPCCWENLPDFSAYRGTGSFRKEFEAEGNVRWCSRVSAILQRSWWTVKK